MLTRSPTGIISSNRRMMYAVIGAASSQQPAASNHWLAKESRSAACLLPSLIADCWLPETDY